MPSAARRWRVEVVAGPHTGEAVEFVVPDVRAAAAAGEVTSHNIDLGPILLVGRNPASSAAASADGAASSSSASSSSSVLSIPPTRLALPQDKESSSCHIRLLLLRCGTRVVAEDKRSTNGSKWRLKTATAAAAAAAAAAGHEDGASSLSRAQAQTQSDTVFAAPGQGGRLELSLGGEVGADHASGTGRSTLNSLPPRLDRVLLLVGRSTLSFTRCLPPAVAAEEARKEQERERERQKLHETRRPASAGAAGGGAGGAPAFALPQRPPQHSKKVIEIEIEDDIDEIRPDTGSKVVLLEEEDGEAEEEDSSTRRRGVGGGLRGGKRQGAAKKAPLPAPPLLPKAGDGGRKMKKVLGSGGAATSAPSGRGSRSADAPAALEQADEGGRKGGWDDDDDDDNEEDNEGKGSTNHMRRAAWDEPDTNSGIPALAVLTSREPATNASSSSSSSSSSSAAGPTQPETAEERRQGHHNLVRWFGVGNHLFGTDEGCCACTTCGVPEGLASLWRSFLLRGNEGVGGGHHRGQSSLGMLEDGAEEVAVEFGRFLLQISGGEKSDWPIAEENTIGAEEGGGGGAAAASVGVGEKRARGGEGMKGASASAAGAPLQETPAAVANALIALPPARMRAARSAAQCRVLLQSPAGSLVGTGTGTGRGTGTGTGTAGGATSSTSSQELEPAMKAGDRGEKKSFRLWKTAVSPSALEEASETRWREEVEERDAEEEEEEDAVEAPRRQGQLGSSEISRGDEPTVSPQQESAQEDQVPPSSAPLIQPETGEATHADEEEGTSAPSRGAATPAPEGGRLLAEDDGEGEARESTTGKFSASQARPSPPPFSLPSLASLSTPALAARLAEFGIRPGPRAWMAEQLTALLATSFSPMGDVTYKTPNIAGPASSARASRSRGAAAAGAAGAAAVPPIVSDEMRESLCLLFRANPDMRRRAQLCADIGVAEIMELVRDGGLEATEEEAVAAAEAIGVRVAGEGRQ